MFSRKKKHIGALFGSANFAWGCCVRVWSTNKGEAEGDANTKQAPLGQSLGLGGGGSLRAHQVHQSSGEQYPFKLQTHRFVGCPVAKGHGFPGFSGSQDGTATETMGTQLCFFRVGGSPRWIRHLVPIKRSPVHFPQHPVFQRPLAPLGCMVNSPSTPEGASLTWNRT